MEVVDLFDKLLLWLFRKSLLTAKCKVVFLDSAHITRYYELSKDKGTIRV